jgi:DNA-directed RNA polymerase specialized sigma24 family protein
VRRGDLAARRSPPTAFAYSSTATAAARRSSRPAPPELSPELREAITAEAVQLEGLEEPLAVIAAVGDTFAALDDALAELALPRLRAVAELRRRGWSYDRIAEATNLSKGRVAQLAREARTRRL